MSDTYITKPKTVTATPEKRDWPGMKVTFEDGHETWYPMPVFEKEFEPTGSGHLHCRPAPPNLWRIKE